MVQQSSFCGQKWTTEAYCPYAKPRP